MKVLRLFLLSLTLSVSWCLRIHATNVVGPETCQQPAKSGALFTPQIVFSENRQDITSMVSTDIDGDGRDDLLVIGPSQHIGCIMIGWYKSIGTMHANADSSEDIIIITEDIKGSSMNGGNLVVVDVDGDGYKDIVSVQSSELKGMHVIVFWLKNTNGKGDFACEHVRHDSLCEPFIAGRITGGFTSPPRVVAGDFNNDGWVDLAFNGAERRTGHYSSDNPLIWMKNTNGKGNFSQHIIVNQSGDVLNLAVADLNNDGWLDIVSTCGNYAPTIRWYQNNGGKGFSKQIVVPTQGNAEHIMSQMAVSDINGDGFNDLVGIYVEQFKPWHFHCSWFKNTLGKFGKFSERSLNFSNHDRDLDSQNGVASLAVADINGDTYNDIVVGFSADGTISWFPNIDGEGNFDKPIYILAPNPATAPLSQIILSDFNNDGKIDCMSSASFGATLAWYKNIGTCCQSGEGASDNAHCTSCHPGYYGSNIGVPCIMCPAGFFSRGEKQSSCLYCYVGKYSAEKGATSSDQCKECAAGRHQSENGRTSCSNCDKGRFQSSKRAENCTACAAGKYSSKVARNTTCDDCDAGKFAQKKGNTNCTACPDGHYSDAQIKGAISCGSCSAGKFGVDSYGGPTCNIPVGLIVLGFLLGIFFASFLLFRRCWQKKNLSQQNQSEAERSLLQNEIAQISEGRQIEFNDLALEKRLAAGAGGEVWQGKWRMMPDQYVAIKRIFLLDKDARFHADNFWHDLNQEIEEGGKEGENKHDVTVATRKIALMFDSSNNNNNLMLPLENNTTVSNNAAAVTVADISWTLEQEISLLMRIPPHPRTVLFIGAGRLQKTGEFFLVSEFMANGDLLHGLNQRTPITNKPILSWQARIQIAADIAEGMAYLHSRTPPIIHRDLKSLNVLLGYDNRAKIADFGLSRFAQAQHEAVTRQSFAAAADGDTFNSLGDLDVTSVGGTMFYMAPESFGAKVVRGGSVAWISKYDKCVDVYSYAIVMLELITCRTPWEEESYVRVRSRVEAGDRPLVTGKEYQAAISRNGGTTMVELMHLCWEQNPQKRPTFTKIVRKLRKIDSVAIMYEEDRNVAGRISHSRNKSYRSPSLESTSDGLSVSSGDDCIDIQGMTASSMSGDEEGTQGEKRLPKVRSARFSSFNVESASKDYNNMTST